MSSPTTVRLTADHQARTERISTRHQISKSTVLRMALEIGLEELEVLLSRHSAERGKVTVSAFNNRFSSPDSHHVAIRMSNTAWAVTYLRRDHRLTRNQAMTAMQLAAVVGASEDHITRKDPIYNTVKTWADELGLDVGEAIAAAERPVRWEEEV